MNFAIERKPPARETDVLLGKLQQLEERLARVERDRGPEPPTVSVRQWRRSGFVLIEGRKVA